MPGDSIVFSSSGGFDNFERWLRRAPSVSIQSILESCGQDGVKALEAATPVEGGTTARSWFYEVRKTSGGWEIVWGNSNLNDGFPVAIMLQYGHGTGTGGYVQGRNYINPAMKPIFDKIADRAWKAVMNA